VLLSLPELSENMELIPMSKIVMGLGVSQKHQQSARLLAMA